MPGLAAAVTPAGDVRITHGSPKRYTAKADSGNEITRVFCGECGTPLYVQVSTRSDIVGVHMDPAVPTFAAYPTGKVVLMTVRLSVACDPE